MMYGKGNSGPATEVWRIGDRVRTPSGRSTGVVASPRRERTANQTNHMWVEWDDGIATFEDPNALDIAR